MRRASSLMERDWPARDVEALLKLIDDPRHRISDTGTYRMSAEQAKAILDLRLQRLTALAATRSRTSSTSSPPRSPITSTFCAPAPAIQLIVKEELVAVKDQFATPRRTVIAEQEGEVEDEDLIHREDMVVTVSHLGYVKRVPLSTYRMQKRGGKAAPACRRAMRISYRGCLWRQRIRRCCSSHRRAASTKRRSGDCRWPRRRRAASR